MKKHQHNLRKIFQNNESLSSNDIENYLEGSVNDDERFRIENTLLDSPLDADAVEGFEEANYSFAQKKPYADFHSFMEKMDNAPSAKIVPMRPRQKMIRRLAVAASFLLLIAAGWFVMNNTSAASNDDLYASYFTSFENDLPVYRGGSEEEEITIMQTFERAMEAYSNGNYAESLPFFEEYLTSEPDSHFAMFYSGLAHLETANYEKAIARFEQAIGTDEKNYREKAKWYLMLAHLKKGDRTVAVEQLKVYVESNARFKNAEAKALLQQITH